MYFRDLKLQSVSVNDNTQSVNTAYYVVKKELIKKTSLHLDSTKILILYNDKKSL